MTFCFKGNVHVAAFGSLMSAAILRQPRYESGFCETLACVTGSVRIPSRPGPTVVVKALPSPRNDDHPVCSEGQERAVTSSASASWFRHRVIAAVTSKEGVEPAPFR